MGYGSPWLGEERAGRGRFCGVLAVSKAAMLQKILRKARKLRPALCTGMSVTLSLWGGESMEHKHEPSGFPGFAPGTLAAPKQPCLPLPASSVGPTARRAAGVTSLFRALGQPGSLPSLPGETLRDFSGAVT